MLNLAEQWGWINSGMGLDLEKLLRQMIDESHPGLPPGYIIMDEVCFFKTSVFHVLESWILQLMNTVVCSFIIDFFFVDYVSGSKTCQS